MSKRNHFVNAIRAVVEALRALHADRYNNWRAKFPSSWKVHYAYGAREQAWLRYACKMLHNWRLRDAEKRADDAAAQKWYDLCKMYDRADKTGSQAELIAYYNVKK